MVQSPQGGDQKAVRTRGLAGVLALCLMTSGCATMSASESMTVDQVERRDLSIAHAPRDLTRTILKTSVRYRLQDAEVELPLLETASHNRKRLSELSALGERPLFRVRTTDSEDSGDDALPKFSVASTLTQWQRARQSLDASITPSALFEDSVNGEIPSSPIQACRLQTCEPNFYWCLGTGIADEERGARWTSAAIFPLDEEDTELPSLQIYGTTTRERDYVQVMPGFFWKPTREFYLTVGVPVGMSDEAPDWGVLVALAR